jgi:hypothetical protein
MPATARSLVPAIALAAAALSACSSGGAEATADASSVCINPTQIESQTIVSDQEIRFEMQNGDVWANRLPRLCPGLKLQGGFSWEVVGTLVCSNEQIITVQNEGTRCALGAFERAAPAQAS